MPSPDPRERPRPTRAELHPDFRDQLTFWIRTDVRIALRVMQLLEEVMRDPYRGLGKPEPLRFDKAGYWSRRINAEHRMVYKIEGERVIFAACRYHYQK